MRQMVIETIEQTVSAFAEEIGRCLWREPVVEFLGARDARLGELRQSVSPGHLMPLDFLVDAESIIAYFIPFREDVVASNCDRGMASKEWAVAFIETNNLIGRIHETLGKLMRKNSYKVGRILDSHDWDEDALIATWSHRHVAHLAGLGAFGAHNMLITRHGCCGRLGTLVTNCPLGPYTVSATEEVCLLKTKRGCGACMGKCDVGAYPDGIYDRKICYARCLENADFYKSLGYADVCGKCTVGLPCSLRSP